MSNKRIEPGLIYHIYNRGNNRCRIFIDDRNYNYFLDLYKRYLLPVTELFAYCLMPNHFHLLLRILDNKQLELNKHSEKSVSLQFATCFGTYTKAFNSKYQRTGTLFEGRFQRKEIRNDNQLVRTLVYIHKNPQKHGYVAGFQEWKFSSYENYRIKDPGPLLNNDLINDADIHDSIMKLHKDRLDFDNMLDD